MKKQQGILFLSHCGYSFLESLTSMANQFGLESYILSSQPLSSKLHRIQEIESICDWLMVAREHQLTWHEVQIAMTQLKGQDKQVLCCLSVWEGYRSLMAMANQALRVKDLSVPAIIGLRDKWILRNTLKNHGKTTVKTQKLTSSVLNECQKNKSRKFIKPRCGIASFAAFALRPTTTWETIKELKHRMHQDKEYSSIFQKNDDFIIEDYIDGTEYCFEILCVDALSHVVAIHEKLPVIENNFTVLEPGCISPPPSLTSLEIKNAVQWVKDIFKMLNLDWGCFHVEAKYHQKHWEIIEINPRVGGALLNQSVEKLLAGNNLLSLWLKTLIYQNESQLTNLKQELSNCEATSHHYNHQKKTNLFYVYFAKPNSKIKNIHKNFSSLNPVTHQVFLNPGDKTDEEAREVFLGQALWSLEESQQDLLPNLMKKAAHAIEVEYEFN